MQDQDAPREAGGEADGGVDAVPTQDTSPAVTGNSMAASTARPWITAIGRR